MNFLIGWLVGLIILIAHAIAVEIYDLKRFSLRSMLAAFTVLSISLGTAAAILRG